MRNFISYNNSQTYSSQTITTTTTGTGGTWTSGYITVLPVEEWGEPTVTIASNNTGGLNIFQVPQNEYIGTLANDIDIRNDRDMKDELVYKSLYEYVRGKGIDLSKLGEAANFILDLVSETDGCWLAGGSVLAIYRDKLDEIKDYDIFFDSEETLLFVEDELVNNGFKISNKSKWSKSFKRDNIIVQLVYISFYESIDAIFNDFDISVCCFALENGSLVYSKMAEKDVENMVMNFIHTKHPVICMKRIARYGAKGFKLTTDFAMRLVKGIRELTDEQIRYSEGIDGS